MNDIFTHYGRFILSSVVIVSIILSFTLMTDGNGNVGLFDVMEPYMSLDADNMENLSDVVETRAHASLTTKPPTIGFDGTGLPFLEAGDDIELLSYLSVTYWDVTSRTKITCRGNVPGNYTLSVLEIKNGEGIDMTSLFNTGTGKITFPQGGTYICVFKATDGLNQSAKCTITIPIDAA